ncbi:hypothetical protein [Candidatus Uabimicrobium sp. HlEnr_7]|uniref:hypothetical protein n=1 Tax=Candidatus Uabimicrobium helgolandensis TaxID=3095367 RepID=UPI0035573B6E
MIATNHFIFVHMFRSGGTTVNNFLSEHFEGKMIGYHRPRKMIPASLQHLPVLGTIRNPWDWYVSVYHHAINFGYPKGASTFLNWLLDFEKLDFKNTIPYLLRIKDIPQKEKVLAYFPNTYDWKSIKIDNLTKSDCEKYLTSSYGFWSWLIEHMYCVDEKLADVSWCKTNSLDEFHLLLEKFNTNKEAKNKPITNHLNSMTGHNSYLQKNVPVPRKKDYREYYDDETRNWVYEKDRKYIDYFGFEF